MGQTLASPQSLALLTQQVADYITGVMKQNPLVFDYPVDVYNFIEEDDTNTVNPAIRLEQAGIQEDLDKGDTERVYWFLPINVLIQDRESPLNHEKKLKYTTWRKCLMDAFKQRWICLGGSNLPNMQADVRPRAIFDRSQQRYQTIQSHFQIVLWVVEPRSDPG